MPCNNLLGSFVFPVKLIKGFEIRLDDPGLDQMLHEDILCLEAITGNVYHRSLVLFYLPDLNKFFERAHDNAARCFSEYPFCSCEELYAFDYLWISCRASCAP